MQELKRVKEMFSVVNEAEARSEKYVNIFTGILKQLRKINLIACKPLGGILSSSVIFTIMNDSLKEMNVARGNFLLLLSVAARYMIEAA